MNKIDETDMEIIAELAENSKMSTKILARKLGVHPNTLLQRIKRLESKGVIKRYVAQIDYKKVGYDLHVLVLIKVIRGRVGDPEQLKDITGLKEVEMLYATAGMWDLIASVRVKNRQHLLDVLQKIGKNKMIIKTASYLTLYTYKSPQEFNPF